MTRRAPHVQNGRLRLVCGAFRAAPPVVDVGGESVTLRYAAPEALAAQPETTLRNMSLSVQVRHSPGVALGSRKLRGQV